MTLDYNIFLELAVIPLDIVLIIYLFMRFNDPTKVNIAFRRFAFAVTITDIVDVATAVVTSAGGLVPNFVHYIFNTADSALAGLSGYLFIYYIYAYSSMDEEDLSKRRARNVTFLILDFLILLINPFTGWVFRYDEAGNYIHEFLFTPVAYGFPILFFAIGSLYMFTHRERYKKSQIISMATAIVIAGGLFLLQMLFFDDMLITFFIASIGILVIFLSLEAPEYERLVKTMAELEESKKREAAVESQARLSKQVMLALSKAVDAKDHYTNGHSERVALYARMMAERMGKTREEIKRCCGTQFDPDIAKYLLDMIDEDRGYFLREIE